MGIQRGGRKVGWMQRTCPDCGGTGIRIIYGLPSPELAEAAERGDVALGGCIIGDEARTAGAASVGTTGTPRTFEPEASG